MKISNYNPPISHSKKLSLEKLNKLLSVTQQVNTEQMPDFIF